MTAVLYYSINQPEVVGEMIDGEAVIINLESGTYYSLTDAGGFIWSQIETQASVDEIIAQTLAHYQGDEATIVASTRRLLDELVKEGLIAPSAQSESEPMTAADSTALTGQERLPFGEPVLGKYTDMAELLLLDPIHEVDGAGWPTTVDGAQPDLELRK